MLTPLYYEHALACEGRAASGLPADAKLLFTKEGAGGGGITLVPANEASARGREREGECTREAGAQHARARTRTPRRTL